MTDARVEVLLEMDNSSMPSLSVSKGVPKPDRTKFMKSKTAKALKKNVFIVPGPKLEL